MLRHYSAALFSSTSLIDTVSHTRLCQWDREAQAKAGLADRQSAEMLAERVGFEPTVHLHAHWFSRPAQSATLSPLRWSSVTGESYSATPIVSRRVRAHTRPVVDDEPNGLYALHRISTRKPRSRHPSTASTPRVDFAMLAESFLSARVRRLTGRE